jgi:hypothetical protein
MSPRIRIVKRIENNFELLVPLDVKLRLLDIRVISFDLDCFVEATCGLFCDLYAPTSATLHTSTLQ